MKLTNTVFVGLLASVIGSTHALEVSFTVPENVNPFTSISWPTIGGFQFNPYWASNNGRDIRNAPMANGNQVAITSTFGSIQFESISIGGTPWDGAGFGFYGNLPLTFYNSNGHIVAARSILLTGSDTFQEFTETIPEVYSILIGSGSFSGLNIRLNSIIFDSASIPSVPEPKTWLLSIAGLFVLGYKIRCKQQENAA